MGGAAAAGGCNQHGIHDYWQPRRGGGKLSIADAVSSGGGRRAFHPQRGLYWPFFGVDALVVGMPDWTIIARCTLVAVTASFGHWLIFMATTRASAAEIAPMTYIQLLMAIGLGIILFGDWPDLTSLAGAGIIIASGLLLWRGSR